MSRYKKRLEAKGIITAIITPFDDREELDEEGLRVLIRRQLAAGVDGLLCLGTNGEFYSLSFEEKIRVVEITVEEAAGQVPVYAGAGSASLKETTALAKRFESAGVDGLTVLAPYFMSYTQEELVSYFLKTADSTDLPLTLYNMPSRTGNALLPGTVARLAAEEKIIGIKDSSGSFDTIIQYLEAVPPGFAVLSGNDGLILTTLMNGGRGAVSAMANICPKTLVSMYNHWNEGRIAEAEQEQRVLLTARRALRLGTQPAALKAFVGKLDLPAGPARQPVGRLTDAELTSLEAIVQLYMGASRNGQ